MDQVRIGSIQSLRGQNLILLLVLANEVEAQENHGRGHACVARQVHTPGNMIPRRVSIEEDLRAYPMLVEHF